MIVLVEDATLDLLRELGISLKDLLDAMDEDKSGILESVAARVIGPRRAIEKIVYETPSRVLNLALFMLQTFYIVNPSGMYKGRLIVPFWSDVMVSTTKASLSGFALLIKAAERLLLKSTL